MAFPIVSATLTMMVLSQALLIYRLFGDGPAVLHILAVVSGTLAALATDLVLLAAWFAVAAVAYFLAVSTWSWQGFGRSLALAGTALWPIATCALLYLAILAAWPPSPLTLTPALDGDRVAAQVWASPQVRLLPYLYGIGVLAALARLWHGYRRWLGVRPWPAAGAVGLAAALVAAALWASRWVQGTGMPGGSH